VVLVFLALVVPLMPVIATMADYAINDRGDPAVPDGWGFGMTNLPPILCSGVDANTTFYSIIFVIVLFTEVGMTLLIFTFWNVRKVSLVLVTCGCGW